jgi:hypothetical protein
MHGDFTAALARLRQAKSTYEKNDEVARIVRSRDEVLARFQPLLQHDNIKDLTEEAIRPFFYFEHNKHWSGLVRQVNRVCGDMNEFRAVLTVLMDEDKPIEARLDEITGRIRGLGKGIVTALLLVAYPDRYGVWNSTSDGGLIAVGLMPNFAHGTSFGSRYAKINSVLNSLARELDVDLWTLDALWWMVQLETGEGLPESEELVPAAAGAVVEAETQFALERHLHHFLSDNWDATTLGRDWQIYTRPGEPEAGVEFACGIGRIDILARAVSDKLGRAAVILSDWRSGTAELTPLGKSSGTIPLEISSTD